MSGTPRGWEVRLDPAKPEIMRVTAAAAAAANVIAASMLRESTRDVLGCK
jgi:hypothetical protein